MTELGLVRRHSTSTYSTAKDERAAGWEKTVGKGDLDSRLTREVRVCNFIIKKKYFRQLGYKINLQIHLTIHLIIRLGNYCQFRNTPLSETHI